MDNTPAKHAHVIPDGFHEPTSKALVSEYTKKVSVAMQERGTIDGISKELGSSPNDWYGMPTITNNPQIRRWMRRV